MDNAKRLLSSMAPKGTVEMMSFMEKAYQADTENRREFILNFSPQQVAIAVKDMDEGVVYDQNGVRVTAFTVKHANLKDAFGFRVDYGGHAVVISGDMAPNENFVKYAQGADVVIHEVGVARPELLERIQNAPDVGDTPLQSGGRSQRLGAN